MSLFDFLFGLFDHSDAGAHDSSGIESHASNIIDHGELGIHNDRSAIGAESSAINSANGLPMVGGGFKCRGCSGNSRSPFCSDKERGHGSRDDCH